ncbi:MAG: ATP-grasp domain-containing protein [bacterium]
MNILISSAGRQVYLINAFKEALNDEGYVFAADNNRHALALKVADRYLISPPYESKDYLPWLFDKCKTNRIKLLITLNVDELLFLQPQKEFLEQVGCFLLGGDIDIIKMTYDKLALSKFSKKIGIDTPKIFSVEELHSNSRIDFPLIAKPRYGKGSRGQIILDSYNSLQKLMDGIDFKIEKDQTYIFQQYINGSEFGLDIVNDFHSNPAATFVREKHSMQNGETFEATTRPSKGWERIGKLLSKNLNHQGTVDVDFIVENNRKYLIDINHRFGGGYIFSHIAGANLPKTFINWLTHKTINLQWLNPTPGVRGQRHDLDIKIVNK